jgi:Mrp family chromosome partitioning ATPase
MSKIVEALERAAKARAKTAGGLVPVLAPAATGGETVARFPLSAPAGGAVAPALEPTDIVRSMEAIARMREDKPLSAHEREAYKIIAPEPAPGSPVEVFRSLRTEIQRRLPVRNAVIMVSSLCARGGASFVAANLAAAFALDAARTALLIDGNLRQPAFGRLVKQRPYHGLVDYLEDPALSTADILHAVGIERLRVIPAGEHVRESIGEYFSSARMLALVQELRTRYPERVVIFDAPPMTDSADTRILASLCDGIVLVVPYGRVRAEMVSEALREIGSERLLAVVFNDEPPPPSFFWQELVRPWFARWRQRLGRLPWRGRIFAREHRSA